MQHKSAASCQVRQFSFWWIWGKSNKQALCSQWSVSKISQLFIVHLHGQSALQGKRRCPSSLLVFWGGTAFPAQGWDAGTGTPHRGPAETGACQSECLAEKMLDFGLRSLPWQLLSVSTEVTLGGEELRQPGGRLPAGPLGCCMLWNNRPTENDTNAWRGLRCFSLTSDYISCSALNSQPDFWRRPSTNTCKLRAVVLAGSFAWGSRSSGAAAHGVWRCGAGARARLSCRPLSFTDEVWKMCALYHRVLNSSAWKLWWSKFHLKKKKSKLSTRCENQGSTSSVNLYMFYHKGTYCSYQANRQNNNGFRKKIRIHPQLG